MYLDARERQARGLTESERAPGDAHRLDPHVLGNERRARRDRDVALRRVQVATPPARTTVQWALMRPRAMDGRQVLSRVWTPGVRGRS